MFQTIHRVGQWKEIREDRKRKGHGGHREEDPAKEDHGKPEEVGHGHRLKNFFHSHRDQYPKKGEGQAGKDIDENKGPEVSYGKSHEWNQDEGDENGHHQPKKGAPKRFT